MNAGEISSSNTMIDNGVPSNASDWDNHDEQSIPNRTLNDNDVKVVDVVRPIFTPANVNQSSVNANVNMGRINNSTYHQEVPFQPAAPMAPMAHMAQITSNYQGSQYRYDPPSYAQNQRMQNHQTEQGGQPQWSLPMMPNRLDERIYFERAPGYTPEWGYFLQPPQQNTTTNNASAQASQDIRAYALSLLSQHTFTVTAVSHYHSTNEPNLNGMRIHIKRITNKYGNGQKAVFEKVMNTEGNEEGRWRIPISAYYAFHTYLCSDKTAIVTGIPEHQLKIASMGRKVSEQGYPSPEELIKSGVPPVLAKTLAPYQRGGVNFALMKGGRVLIADDMGLGKTIQSIASMACYREEWPLLILSPSTARFHWKNELVQWLGNKKLASNDDTDESENEEAVVQDVNPLVNKMQKLINKKRRAEKDMKKKQSKIARQNSEDNDDCYEPLSNEHINVIIKGTDAMLPKDNTRVVICSYGLATNLIETNKINPGLFRCIIVDESHMLKSNKSKRTIAILPLLKAASRVIMLSGTPAFSKPYELYPQLSSLLNHMWISEDEYIKRYCQGGGDGERKDETGDAITADPRLAELHTMLTSTVMIRRTKQEVLKNLPGKVRESAHVKVRDTKLKHENTEAMRALRKSRGILGRLSRQHHSTNKSKSEIEDASQDTDVHHPHDYIAGGDAPGIGSEGDPSNVNADVSRKAILGHAFKLSGISKVPIIIDMLDKFLSDSTSGKICIFAHHTSVIDSIVEHLKQEGHTFMSITGATMPRIRQEHIHSFQTDPSVRVAVLGITAAGVGVTLTAASTVWFAELFWTPAILIQAEDRCHRIGQQARVHCLYLIAEGTLDEILWLLVKKKFRDLGEFVEGKEKLDIVVHKHYLDEWSAVNRICGASENEDANVGEVDLEKLDNTDLIECDMEEMASEEQASKRLADDEDDDDDDVEVLSNNLVDSRQLAASQSSGTTDNQGSITVTKGTEESTTGAISNCAKVTVIDVSDDEVECVPNNKGPPDISDIAQRHNDEPNINVILHGLSPAVLFPMMQFYTVSFNDKSYGLGLANYSGRVIVQKSPQGIDVSEGSIIVAINNSIIPHNTLFRKVMEILKYAIRTPPVVLTFAEDKVFEKFWIEVLRPGLRNYTEQIKRQKAEKEKQAQSLNKKNASDVIDLLDD